MTIKSLDGTDLRAVLPHKCQAVVLDELTVDIEEKRAEGVLEIVRLTALHTMAGHTWAFPGHWMIEMASLTCAVLAIVSFDIKTSPEKGVFLTGVDRVRFRNGGAGVGDTLVCRAKLLDYRGFDYREALKVASFKADVFKNEAPKPVCSIQKITGLIVT